MSELTIKNTGQMISTETIDGDIATLNLGPTHPATHGIFQNILKVDGERILSAEPTIGYIHRAFEKLAERRPYNQITPITDRLNYCSSPINNIGWHLTVRKIGRYRGSQARGLHACDRDGAGANCRSFGL
jgi:NADH-quinone oxidoreductase subunit D